MAQPLTDNLPNTTGGGVLVLDSPSQMHAAFDPDGTDVWCDYAEEVASTNDGFCQYCGRRDHAAA